jgi:hypothetical protein
MLRPCLKTKDERERERAKRREGNMDEKAGTREQAGASLLMMRLLSLTASSGDKSISFTVASSS